jgi:hypothetical protein
MLWGFVKITNILLFSSQGIEHHRMSSCIMLATNLVFMDEPFWLLLYRSQQLSLGCNQFTNVRRKPNFAFIEEPTSHSS